MKIEKVKFEKIDRFKELIELTGLVSYSVDSDDGRDMLIDPECIKEHDLNSELHDFLYDFHWDCLCAAEGSAELQIVRHGIHILWSESRDLLLEGMQYDLNEMFCALFSLPSESTIHTLFNLNYKLEGTLKRQIEIETFVIILSVNPIEILEYGFTVGELKKVKAGLLFKNANQIHEKFQIHLKKLLKKYRARNCTFSLSGNECGPSFFYTSEIENRKIVLFNE